MLDTLYRHEAKELIESYGGRLTESVSKKTSFLLAGLDAGKTKYTQVASA